MGHPYVTMGKMYGSEQIRAMLHVRGTELPGYISGINSNVSSAGVPKVAIGLQRLRCGVGVGNQVRCGSSQPAVVARKLLLATCCVADAVRINLQASATGIDVDGTSGKLDGITPATVKCYCH